MWNMFDFAVDARDEGGIKGLNTKGLVSHDRKLRKDSFYVYQAFWTHTPMVHIAGRRFEDRAPGERTIRVFTNCDAVTLLLNGKTVATKTAVDHMAVFEELPMVPGENVITAQTGEVSDTITLNAVQTHNEKYDLPDLAEALQAGNWFEESQNREDTSVEGGYDLSVPVGQLLANPQCLRAVKGWIMHSDIAQSAKLVSVSRLTNWQAMWSDRTLRQLNGISRHMTEEDFQVLETVLKRIKRT